MNKFYYSAIILLSIFLLGKPAEAQVSNYNFSQNIVPGSYNNLLLTDTFMSGGALGFDFISGDIVFPGSFTFSYNCREYSSFRVSNNGFILLGLFGNPVLTESNAIANTTNIPAEGVIQPFGIDMANSIASGANSAITYGLDPTTTSGAFVIQYKDMARSNANADKINVQIWLYPNGNIQFRYGSCTPSGTSTSSNSPTVGIKGGYTNDFLVRAVSAVGPASTWTNSARGTSIFSTSRYVGTAVSPYGSIYPLPNLVYAFTPVACFTPTLESAPDCTTMESGWFLTPSGTKVPSKTWTKWPSRGQNAWFSDYENAGVTKWTNPTQGSYLVPGADGSQHSARFHTYSLAKDYYGDLDLHLDLSNCATAAKQLNFYYLNNTTGTDNLKVFLSTDGGSTFSIIGTYNAQSAWSQKTINLGVVSASNAVIRFRATSDGVSQLGSDIGIDQICVSGTGTAPTVTTTPSAQAHLCKVGQGVSSVNLSASGAANYKWSPVFGLNSVTGSTVTATPSATTTYTVIASDANCVTASKTIEVEVAPTIQLTTIATPPSLCYGSTTTLSGSDSAIGTQSLPIGYCNTGPLSGLDEDCGKVVFAGINNTSPQNGLVGSQGTATGVPSIYSNFTASVSPGQVLTGDAYPISITVIDDGGTTFQNATKVFIDYNRDGDFDDSGELVFTTNYTYGGNVQNGSVVIPNTAKAGVTKMRVCVYETTPGNITACGTPNNYGEVEDYAINIVKRPAVSGPGSSYVWSPSTYLNTNSGTSVVASGVTTNITYTLTATDPNGCYAISLRPIFVSSTSPLSTNPIAGSGNICIGTSTNLGVVANGGTPPYSYVWTGQNITGTGASVSVAPTSSSTYTVTVSDGCGATSSRTKTIIISGAPPVSASASPAGLCPGQSTTLQASGASSYAWSGGVSSGVPFTPTSTNTYTVTGTSGNGCTKTATVTVQVHPLPTLGASANPGVNVCNGTPVTLNGAGAASYIWSHNVTNAVAFTPTTTSTYTVTGTSSQGCTNTMSLTVSVNMKPTVTATKTPNFTTCKDVPVTLNGSGANTYSWTGGVVNNVSFTPNATNTYTVTGVSSNGCTNTATILAVIHQLPTITASASPSGAICLNENVVLNGSGGVLYAWSGGVTNNSSFSPTTTTTYTVTGTASTGCTNTTTQSVVVNSLPNVNATASPSNSICLNEGVSLSGSGASSYSWSGNVSNGQSFSPTSTATYTVTGTGSNGCTKTHTETVTVNALPNVNATASPSNSICLNEGVSLSGSGASSYSWSGNVSNGQSFSPTSTTTYTVTGTGSNGCTKTHTETVTVNALPNVNATASPSNSICLNEGVSLSGSGASSYSWSGNVSNGQSFSPTSTTTYTVTGMGSNGCTKTHTETVTVKPLPNVNALASPSNSICLNENVTLTGSGASTYVWSGGVTNAQSFTPPSTSTFTLTGTGINGCTNTHTETITIKPLPTINANASPANVVCAGESVLLSGSGAQSYSWTGSILNNTSFIPTATGTYTVTGTASNNCTNTDVVTITVNPIPTVGLSIEPSAVVCESNSVKFTASGATSYSWTGGVSNGVPFKATSTSNYTVTGSNAQSCTATAVVNLLVNNSPILAQATTTNNSSITGNQSSSMNHFDGANLIYTDINCNSIMEISDASGGNSLGMVNAAVTVEPNIIIHAGHPYGRRWYSATPTNNGPAIVTLYFTQDDFNDYNAASANYPLLPTMMTNSDPKIANVRITKVNGSLTTGVPTLITPSVYWDPLENRWEISFPVSSFSQFYLHSPNAQNTPLPVALSDFYGLKVANGNKLHWVTESENNNSHFNILKSKDNVRFTNIGRTQSKATNGNSNNKIAYNHFDEDINIGNNFYKLEQVDIDGNKSYSNTINLIWADLFTNILIYPNPARDFINIDFEAEEQGAIMKIKVMDMSGRVAHAQQAFAIDGRNSMYVDLHNLASGIYTLQLTEDNKTIHVQKIIVGQGR